MKTRSKAGADGADGSVASPALHADSLLGYEDGAEGADAGRSRAEGDAHRARLAQQVYGARDGSRDDDTDREPNADQDAGDLSPGVDEDALDQDELDTDRVTSTEAVAAAMRIQAMRIEAERVRGRHQS